MTNTSWLPKFLRWMFTIFAIFTALGALALCILLAIDPTLPPGLHFGPHAIAVNEIPATVTFRNSTFVLNALHGGLSATVQNTGALIELLKHYGLPVLILSALFYTALFDLLRRLFRNVGRGESFTRQTVRLVQIIGFSLLAFSIVSAFADGLFIHALYSYLAQHATIFVSGTAIHLPQPQDFKFSGSHEVTFSSSGDGSVFGSPLFFTGLLVLALSEVFRQGLVLKSEHDLTV
jgi:hypothetical protein